MSNTMEETIPWSVTGDLPDSIALRLSVIDRDTIRALTKYAAGSERDEFALEALKIGVLALRHASGALDADFIQRETTRLVDTLRHQLDEHARHAQDRLAGSLKEYFDPEGGRFNQRVQRLVANDGDLARLLRGSLDGDDSRLAKTLLTHVGRKQSVDETIEPRSVSGFACRLAQQCGRPADPTTRSYFEGVLTR